MKIVILTGNRGSGGLIAYINGLLHNDFDESIQITLFCGEVLANTFGMLSSRVKTVVTKYASEKGIDVIFDRPLNKEYVSLIKDENPDVVFFVNGYIRKGLEMYPNIMTFHNQLFINSSYLYQMGLNKQTITLLALQRVVRKSIKKAAGVVFLSEFSKSEANKKKIFSKSDIIIPFGIEEENLRNDPVLEFNSLKQKIIYISALLPYKNHKQLLLAFAKLVKENNELELMLVGEKFKSVYNKLLKIIHKKQLENNVHFYGWVNHTNIKNLIDGSDIFVYASSLETTGYGLIEGMARGALIASSNQAGLDKILLDSGVLFNPRNVREIYVAIKTLLSIRKDTEIELRAKAIKYCSKYSWKDAFSLHMKFVADVIERSKKENV